MKSARFSYLLHLLMLCSGLATLTEAQPCKEVIGYYCNWQWYDRNKLVNPMTIPYSKYSIINYAFFNPQTNGTIVTFDSWADDNILLGPMNWSTNQPITSQSLPYQCHLNNVKLLVSIGGWTGSNNFPGIAADPVKRTTFAHSCNQLIRTYGFDGIDIDWEYPGYVDHGGTAADKANFNLLLQQLRDSLTALGNTNNRTYLLTAALPAGPSNMANIDWLPVSNLLDIMNIMTYDFFGSWDNIANHNSPLYAPLQGDPALNCNAAIQTLIGYGVPRSKITMGVPFYGRAVKSQGNPALFGSIYHQPDNTTFPEDDGNPLYYNLLPRYSLFTAYWDNQSKTPYLLGNGTLNTFVSYDDTTAIGFKAQYIVNNNLRGAIVWEITGDVLETAPGSGLIASTPLASRLNAGLCNGSVSTCPAPSGISIGSIGNTVAVVSWTAVTGNSYTVFWKRTNDLSWNSASTNGSSYSISSLTACTSYQYKVRSDCPGGITAESTVSNFQTTGCCNTPSGLSVSSVTSSSATLAWTSTGASSYSVQYKVATAAAWTTVTSTTNNCNLTGLAACTGYVFQVAGTCGTTNSAYSATSSFQTNGCTVCLLPTNLMSSNLTSSGALLSWGSTGASSYSVRFRKSGITTWTTAVVTQPSCSLTGLSGCTNYEWQAGSICPGITTTYSYIASFSTVGCTNTCQSVPGNLLATSVTASSVTLSWTGTGAATYRIQYRPSSATTWTAKTTSGTSYSLTRLSSCTDYVWRVRAECSNSNVSQYSTTALFKTSGCSTTCLTPSGLTATNMTATSGTISWTSTGASSYLLEYKTTTATQWTSITTTATSYNLTGLTSCAGYQTRITGICGSSSSTASAAISFQTTGCCPSPTGVSVSAVTSSDAVASWNITAGISYNLQYKAASAATWTTVSAVNSPYTLTGLISCTGYSVQVQAVCSSSSVSPYSAPVSFSTTGCSSGGPAPTNYCSSYSLNATAEYIQTFSVSNLNNVSGNNNGFGNYINLTANLVAGRNDTLRFTPGFTGTSMTEYWTVLIDFNRNGSFADAGERVAQVSGSGTSTISIPFTTPTAASNGGARMRIQMKRAGYAAECDIYSYGEVEDYLVNIAASSPRLSDGKMTTEPVVYPNPAGAVLFVSFESVSRRTVQVLDLNGRVVLSAICNEAEIQLDLSTVTSGTYLLQTEGPSGVFRTLFVRN